MKTISLKVDDNIFKEAEKIIHRLKKPRNRYINEAINYYNHHQKRLMIEKKLNKESYAVREESIRVLSDFEDIDYVD